MACYIQQIKPMTDLSGFPEFLPGQQVFFDQWKARAESHFSRHGFLPLDTPAVERLSTLLSKGDDHEIYQVVRFKDEGVSDKTLDQKMGLRFDLTVPLARYVMSHQGHLTFPYRRYHIAPVWRGERAQKGRYRQFYQCDIDVVGRKALSPHYSCEMIAMMSSLLSLLDPERRMGPLTWSINHRCILNRWADHAGIRDLAGALRWIDKKDKIPFDNINNALSDLGASTASIDQLNIWADYSRNGKDIYGLLRSLNWGDDFQEAIRHIESTIRHVLLLGADQDDLVFDPLLARGLTYYSGLTYEATLRDHVALGAICAGGQYDHLAESLGSQESFPGVGLSLGLSRLFSYAWDMLSPACLAPATILVTAQDPKLIEEYLYLAYILRQSGLSVETYLETRSLGDQLKYASTQGHPFVVIANAEEIQAQKAIVKTMGSGAQKTLDWKKISDFIQGTES